MRLHLLRFLCLILTSFAGIQGLQAQPMAQGDEFQVNSYTTADQSSPAVAADGSGNFVVVWRSLFQDGDNLGVFGQRFDPLGVPLDGEFLVHQGTLGGQIEPAVGMGQGGEFVVTWTDVGAGSGSPDGSGRGVFGRRFGADGVAQGNDFQVHSGTADDQERSAVAVAPDGRFIATWMSASGDGSDRGVFAQRYDGAGAANGGELLVNTTTANGQRDPDIAVDSSGNFVITWYDYGFPSPDGDLFGVFAQRFNSTGAPVGGELQINQTSAGYQFEPAIAMRGNGEFVVVWDSYLQDGDRDGIFAQRFDSAGQAVGSEMQVNTYTTGRQHSGDVAMDASGAFVVTWQSEEGSGPSGLQSRIVARAFDSTGVPVGGEFQVDTAPNRYPYFPAVTSTGNDQFVIAWQSRSASGSFDVRARRYGEPETVDPALVGLWTFDEGAGTVVANLADNGLDGVLEGGSGFSPGQQASALALDGVDDLVRVSDPGAASPLDVTDALTLSAWVRPDRLDGSTQVIVSKDNAYELEVGKLGAAVWDLRLDNQVVATAPTPLEEGVWQHLSATWDGTTVRFYYNGLLDGSAPFGGVLIPNDDDLGLGGRPAPPLVGGPVFHFSGALDHVAVYNRVLDDQEIAQAVLDTLTDNLPPEPTNLLPSGSLPSGTTLAQLAATTDEGATCRWDSAPNTRFDDMANVFTTTGGTTHETDVAVSDGTVYGLRVRCRDALGNTGGNDGVARFAVGDSDLTSGALTLWQLDEGTGCVAADGVSGLNGSLGPACPANGPQWSTGHDGGSALTFDGVDDRVTVANAASLASPAGLTLSAWIRHPSNTYYRAIFDARDAGNDGYDLYIEPGSRLLMRVNDATLTGQRVVADGDWHHVVGTWDGSELRLYVDGVLDASAAIAGTSLDVASDLLLGQNFATVDYVLDGDLSRASMWDRGLSAVEVLDLYLATR